ncbi:MAG: carboxypeptidase regulatory-like domain-containing protein [Chloroflexi bacterium]|nr:carboxypeptidase regulatory-like domain-containing protein [Chloroflexota bacterium]
MTIKIKLLTAFIIAVFLLEPVALFLRPATPSGAATVEASFRVSGALTRPGGGQYYEMTIKLVPGAKAYRLYVGKEPYNWTGQFSNKGLVIVPTGHSGDELTFTIWSSSVSIKYEPDFREFEWRKENFRKNYEYEVAAAKAYMKSGKELADWLAKLEAEYNQQLKGVEQAKKEYLTEYDQNYRRQMANKVDLPLPQFTRVEAVGLPVTFHLGGTIEVSARSTEPYQITLEGCVKGPPGSTLEPDDVKWEAMANVPWGVQETRSGRSLVYVTRDPFAAKAKMDSQGRFRFTLETGAAPDSFQVVFTTDKPFTTPVEQQRDTLTVNVVDPKSVKERLTRYVDPECTPEEEEETVPCPLDLGMDLRRSPVWSPGAIGQTSPLSMAKFTKMRLKALPAIAVFAQASPLVAAKAANPICIKGRVLSVNMSVATNLYNPETHRSQPLGGHITEGPPSPRATVRVKTSSGNEVATAFTNANGGYALLVDGSGEYVLEASANSQYRRTITQKQTLTVRSGQTDVRAPDIRVPVGIVSASEQVLYELENLEFDLVQARMFLESIFATAKLNFLFKATVEKAGVESPDFKLKFHYDTRSAQAYLDYLAQNSALFTYGAKPGFKIVDPLRDAGGQPWEALKRFTLATAFMKRRFEDAKLHSSVYNFALGLALTLQAVRHEKPSGDKLLPEHQPFLPGLTGEAQKLRKNKWKLLKVWDFTTTGPFINWLQTQGDGLRIDLPGVGSYSVAEFLSQLYPASRTVLAPLTGTSISDAGFEVIFQTVQWRGNEQTLKRHIFWTQWFLGTAVNLAKGLKVHGDYNTARETVEEIDARYRDYSETTGNTLRTAITGGSIIRALDGIRGIKEGMATQSATSTIAKATLYSKAIKAGGKFVVPAVLLISALEAANVGTVPGMVVMGVQHSFDPDPYVLVSMKVEKKGFWGSLKAMEDLFLGNKGSLLRLLLERPQSGR